MPIKTPKKSSGKKPQSGKTKKVSAPTRGKRRSKTKKFSSQDKRLFVQLGFSIFALCAVLFGFSFFLLPNVSHTRAERIELERNTNSVLSDNREDAAAKKTLSINQEHDSGKKNTDKNPQKNENAQNKVDTASVQSNSEKINKNEREAVQKGAEQNNAQKSAQRERAEIKAKPDKGAELAKATPNFGTQKDGKKKNIQSDQSDEKKLPAPITVPLPQKNAVLYFVFDDAGHNLFQLEKFVALPFKCTFAVLPGLAHSKAACEKIRAAGHEVILHQPMQALNLKLDPGPQAVTKDLSPEEACAQIEKNMEALAPLAGMNNHEGSLITSDETVMRAILELMKKKNMVFLDSRTNAQTVVPKIAAELNMKILARDIFLDNIKTRENFTKQLNAGLQIADKQGFAIFIGHIFTPELADFLHETYPKLKAAGYKFSVLSEF